MNWIRNSRLTTVLAIATMAVVLVAPVVSNARPWHERLLAAAAGCVTLGTIGAKIGGVLGGGTGAIAGGLLGCGVGGFLGGWPE